MALLITCAACTETPTGTDLKLDDTYVFSSASLDGINCSDDFQAYTVIFRENGTLRATVYYLGSMKTRNSIYTFDGETIVETFALEKYTYKKDGDTLTTTYQDMDVVLVRQKKEGEDEPVDFEGILFGEDMSDSKYYNYCPAILTETVEGKEVMHVWYCTNRDNGVMTDYIGYRKGVKQEDGKWVFGEMKIVLEPTPNTWDARHTCDPAVIRGNFRYRNTQYSYMMAFLGCVTDDYSKNETGIAVANAPEGPWIKINELNPIVPWQDGSSNAKTDWWGTGMPALINLDGEGDVLLFYQSTARGTGIQRWDFSDIDALIEGTAKPQFTVGLTHNGILNSAGVKCNVHIADFAYDPVAGRFYVCGVTNEKNPPDETLTRVNSHSLVAYLDTGVDSADALCATLESGTYTWKMAGYVGPGDTGFERNHNPGIVRDEYGYVPSADVENDQIRVIVSTGHNSWANENIFTYRLYGKILKTSQDE